MSGGVDWDSLERVKLAALNEESLRALRLENDEIKAELAARKELYDQDLAGLQADRETLRKELFTLQKVCLQVVTSFEPSLAGTALCLRGSLEEHLANIRRALGMSAHSSGPDAIDRIFSKATSEAGS